MTEQSFQPDWFSKPSDTLAALMKNRQMGIHELSAKLKLSTEATLGILVGTISIDDDKADRLAKAVGGSRSFWIKRQSEFEGNLSRVAGAISSESADAWTKRFPLKEMSDQAWLKKPARRPELLKTLLAYFGVSSPEEWARRYEQVMTNVAFRTSQTFESQIGPMSAWLRRGEVEASLIDTQPFDKERLRQSLPELRSLSRLKSPKSFMPKIKRICADAGVAVVFVKAPSGCRASGATTFLGPNKAVIVLSFRHRSDDHFWFTLFHEIGHLLLHGEAATFVDGDGDSENAREREANDFAQSVLIPLDRHEELSLLGPRAERVMRFAVSIGVASGVVVGQLQHLGLIERDKLNFLKRRYDWDEIFSVFG